MDLPSVLAKQPWVLSAIKGGRQLLSTLLLVEMSPVPSELGKKERLSQSASFRAKLWASLDV